MDPVTVTVIASITTIVMGSSIVIVSYFILKRRVKNRVNKFLRQQQTNK